MISYNVKQSKIHYEFDKDNNDNWFNRTKDKFIHNIDTLYYVVYLKGNYNESEKVKSMIEYLEEKKNIALESFESVALNEISSEFITNGMGFGMYAYSIEKKDKFTIFISKKKATKDTPEILVQIRSQFLWLYGEHRAIEESYNDVKLILDKYGIEIENIMENRIDFAYHTNYIQDPLNFFKEENLNKMQVSRFTRWHKEGRFVGDEIVECDYISLGRRKSNNTFLRIYNKSQEVVSQGYKQFFIKVWLFNGLINRFDYYILEKCFKESSYNYVNKARLEFYLEHGLDEEIKERIEKLLKCYDTMALKKLADKLVPDLTIVMNIEVQTKRKFYASMDNCFTLLKSVTFKQKELLKIGRLLDNKDILHEYITNHVIRFVDYGTKSRKKDCDTASWWKLLQNIKLYNVITDKNRKIIRECQRDLDTEKLKKRTLNSLSTMSVYINNENSNSLTSDVVDFMSYLNETDIENSLKYKKKKSALLKNQLENIRLLDYKKSFLIVDSETAEILE